MNIEATNLITVRLLYLTPKSFGGVTLCGLIYPASRKRTMHLKPNIGKISRAATSSL